MTARATGYLPFCDNPLSQQQSIAVQIYRTNDPALHPRPSLLFQRPLDLPTTRMNDNDKIPSSGSQMSPEHYAGDSRSRGGADSPLHQPRPLPFRTDTPQFKTHPTTSRAHTSANRCLPDFIHTQAIASIEGLETPSRETIFGIICESL